MLPRTTALVLTAAAVTVTGAAASGVLADPTAASWEGDVSQVAFADSERPSKAAHARAGRADRGNRAGAVSRSGSRELPGALEEKSGTTGKQQRRGASAKEASLSTDGGHAVTRSEDGPSDPRDIARALLPEYGFSTAEFGCLDALYESESGWDVHADNPTSSAYGIPQALTETHDVPAGYFTSAEVQIRWGLEYIQDSYGTPCSAWEFKQGHNWY